METKLTAELREGTGKGVARKLRAAGRVPAVLYGHRLRPTPISIDAREMLRVLHSAAGSNTLVDLVLDGHEHLALPREVQQDHIHNTLIHVDFLAVSRTETISVNVPVVETGDAAGVREGGVVEHHLRELHIECLPADVPEHVEVDITSLGLGGMVHVADITPPKGVTILNPPEEAVLSIVTPAALRVEADLTLPGAEGAAAAEEAEGATTEEARESAAQPAAEGDRES